MRLSNGAASIFFRFALALSRNLFYAVGLHLIDLLAKEAETARKAGTTASVLAQIAAYGPFLPARMVRKIDYEPVER